MNTLSLMSHLNFIEKVKNSSSLDEDVFDVLDKMENLQNQVPFVFVCQGML